MKRKELTLLRLKSQEIKNSEERQKYGRISLISKLETEYLKEVLKDLDELEELKKIMGTPIQDIMEKLRKLEYYENEKYKHWNIFFNGAKLEYLLYLEQKGKESFMTSISEELYSKIHKHFLE